MEITDLIIGQGYKHKGKTIFYLGKMLTFLPKITKRGKTLCVEYQDMPLTFYIFGGDSLYCRCYQAHNLPKLSIVPEQLSELDIIQKKKGFSSQKGWAATEVALKNHCKVKFSSESKLELTSDLDFDEIFYLEFVKGNFIDEYSSFLCWFDYQ